MAGDESGAERPLVTDFLLVGQRLGQLRFIYDRGKVIIFEKEQYE